MMTPEQAAKAELIWLACRFGWHCWPRWKVIREGQCVSSFIQPDHSQFEASRKALSDGLGKTFKEQQRECPGCGKIQLRTEYA